MPPIPYVLARLLDAAFGIREQSSRPFNFGCEAIDALARFFGGGDCFLQTLLGFTPSFRRRVVMRDRVPERLRV